MKPNLQRLTSIDIVRGLVILLMALDHTRDFFSGAPFDPLDLEHTNAVYFFTRWVTHLCAPTFVFLAGVGAYLSTVRRDMPRAKLSAYLAKRGLWLVILEVTIVRFGWSFNVDYSYVLLQVIWALGGSMLVLSLLVFLPRWAIALFAALTIFGHNFFDAVQPAALGAWGWLWTVLHVPGGIEYAPDHWFFVLYPLVPWVGVMAAGYCMAPLFLQTPKLRMKALLGAALGMLALFVVLRLFNVYGDASPWLAQKDGLMTFFSFLNVTKYPPSLLFLLVTLSLTFLLLVLFEHVKMPWLSKTLLVFGEVPLFFYVLHIQLIHAAALISLYLKGQPYDWLLTGSIKKIYPVVPSPACGYDLPTVYCIWFVLICLLYPLCRFFAAHKHKHPEKTWLRYL